MVLHGADDSISHNHCRCMLYKVQGNGWEGITTDKQIAVLIEAARLAPSGSNKQPWDFLVIKSRELREKISAIDHDQKWMLTAPVFIVCIGNERYRGDGDMERVIRDSAIATEHMDGFSRQPHSGMCGSCHRMQIFC